MAGVEKLIDRIAGVRTELELLDEDLQECSLPVSALEDLKGSVDHIRTTLFAIMSAPQSDGTSFTIARLRLMRASQIARQISTDIDANEITVDMPEVVDLQQQLGNAYSRIERLLKTGA